MNISKIFLFIAVSLNFSIAHSKIMLVSDIDDTIKISHIGDKSDMVLYASAV